MRFQIESLESRQLMSAAPADFHVRFLEVARTPDRAQLAPLAHAGVASPRNAVVRHAAAVRVRATHFSRLNVPVGRRGDVITISATLVDSSGAPVAGRKVEFHHRSDGFTESLYGSAMTNAAGTATIRYRIPTNTADNNIIFTAVFKGDATDAAAPMVEARLPIGGPPATVIPGVPQNFTASATAPNQVVLNWSDPSAGATPFLLTWTAPFWPMTRTISLPAGTKTYMFDAAPNTDYDFALVAVGNQGNSPPATVSNVVTPVIPATPQNFTVSAIAPNQVILNWTDPNVGATPFLLTWTAPDWKVTQAISLPAGTTRYVFDAAPNTGYDFSLVAVSDRGTSPPATVNGVVTPTIGME